MGRTASTFSLIPDTKRKLWNGGMIRSRCSSYLAVWAETCFKSQELEIKTDETTSTTRSCIMHHLPGAESNSLENDGINGIKLLSSVSFAFPGGRDLDLFGFFKR